MSVLHDLFAPTSMIGHWSILAQADPSAVQLTPAGWCVMILSIAFVVGLLVFCLYRVLRQPPGEAE